MLRHRVYISGPISHGDLRVNIAQASRAFFGLLKAGFAPLCPHWSVYSEDACDPDLNLEPVAERVPAGATHEDWIQVDLPWAAVADAVLRLPGESADADRECQIARDHGRPVLELTWVPLPEEAEEWGDVASSLWEKIEGSNGPSARYGAEAGGHPGYLVQLETKPTDLKEFWRQHSQWSQATFGADTERGPIGALNHLAKEVKEALACPSDLTEYADMVFLVFDSCRRAGFSFNDLVRAVWDKFAVNKARKWGPPGPDGACHHVQEEVGDSPGHAEYVPEPGGHPGYLALLDEMKELHVRKAADYGRGADPFANVRASARFGIPGWVGVMVRANDKMERIQSFIANGSLKNESVEDSLKDLAAYALIALALRREAEAAGGEKAARPAPSPDHQTGDYKPHLP